MNYLSVLFTLLGIYGVCSHDFKKCSSVDNMGVKSVIINPENPIPGHSLSVSISGYSSLFISSGVLSVDVRVFGVKVAEQTLSLCSFTKCPINGNYDLSFNHEIPLETPENINADIRVLLLVNDKVVSCLETMVKTGKKDKELMQIRFMYKKWAKMYNKTINNFNFNTFYNNYKRIASHNARNNNARTYELSLNEYADITNEEFTKSKLNRVKNNNKYETNSGMCVSQVLPYVKTIKNTADELDYTKSGAVSRVKNQGQCGSCWAFATTGAIESAYYLKYKKMKEFSEQQIVSCDTVDLGCRGGTQDQAFEFIEKAGGLCEEKEYAYTSDKGSFSPCIIGCTRDINTIPKKIIDIPPSEDALMAALVQHGPVVVDIEADQAVFQFYKSGVISKWCGSKLDHAVLLVGYGHDNETGLDFWKLKNSWGPGWGENGYVRIERHKKFRIHGLCGIASSASFPVL